MAERTRIAEGVYRDKYGVAATVKVGTVQREHRFPPESSLDYIQAWRARTRSELLEDRDAIPKDTPAPERRSFASDLPRYLKKIEHRVGYKSDRSHLRAWLPLIGPLLRSKIRPVHIQRGIETWAKAGKAPRTLRHRRRVIREMWKTLDGVHARPPVTGIKIPTPAQPHPVAVPWSVVKKVAESLRKGKRHAKGYGGDSDKAHARFLVRATTGQRPASIMRAVPADLDLKRRLWLVRPTKGGDQVALPLDPHMVQAWKAFIAAKAWGPFDVNSFAATIRRHGWPKGVRPYSLRSTFAIDMILGGADLGDVQAAMGHRRIETTRAHYAPIQLARLRKALKLRKRATL